MTDGAYEEAKRAVERVQRLSDDCRHALDASCQAMDDDAWVGPVARQFHDALRSGRRELQARLGEAVGDARAKLATMPGKP